MPMPSKSTTIRVTNQARETLRELSQITGKRQQDVVDEAFETYRRQVLLDRANAAYAALRSDAKAWEAELEERAADDATRKVFALLKTEELKHKRKLETEYEDGVLEGY